MATSQHVDMSHASAPWARYAGLAPLLQGEGLKLSPGDYDFAARCINERAEMLEALRLCEQFVADGRLHDGCGNPDSDGVFACLKRPEALALLRAAIAKATAEG